MIKKLNELGTVKVPRRIQYTKGEKYKLLDATALNIYDLYHTHYRKTDDKTNLLCKGDIVIISFDYAGNALGYSFYVDKDKTYVAGIDTIIIRNCTVNPEALAFYLRREDIKKQFAKYSNVALVTSKRISPNVFDKIDINLKCVDMIENNLKILRSFDKEFTDLYLRIEKTEFLYTGLRRMLMEQVVKTNKENIESHCNITMGAPIKPKNIVATPDNKHKFPVISNTNTVIGYTDKCNTPQKYILYNSRGGNIGVTALWNKKAFAINKMMIIEVKDMNPSFLAHQLSFFLNGLEGNKFNKFISLGKLKNSSIFVPPKSQQDKVAKCLDELEKNIELNKQYIKVLITLKKKIINKEI